MDGGSSVATFRHAQSKRFVGAKRHVSWQGMDQSQRRGRHGCRNNPHRLESIVPGAAQKSHTVHFRTIALASR